jgi:hypothetical protein
MNRNDLNHQTAVNWIEDEFVQFQLSIGQRNAGWAVRSVVHLSVLLGAISREEYREFENRISQMYAEFNGSERSKAS